MGHCLAARMQCFALQEHKGDGCSTHKTSSMRDRSCKFPVTQAGYLPCYKIYALVMKKDIHEVSNASESQTDASKTDSAVISFIGRFVDVGRTTLKVMEFMYSWQRA